MKRKYSDGKKIHVLRLMYTELKAFVSLPEYFRVPLYMSAIDT